MQLKCKEQTIFLFTSPTTCWHKQMLVGLIKMFQPATWRNPSCSSHWFYRKQSSWNSFLVEFLRWIVGVVEQQLTWRKLSFTDLLLELTHFSYKICCTVAIHVPERTWKYTKAREFSCKKKQTKITLEIIYLPKMAGILNQTQHQCLRRPNTGNQIGIISIQLV